MNPSSLLGYGVKTGDYSSFLKGGPLYPEPTKGVSLGYSGLGTQSGPSADEIAAQEYAKAAAQIASLKQPVGPAAFDFNSANAKARKAAEGYVNPLYLKKLNDYLTTQHTLQAQKQEDVTRQNAQIDQLLGQTTADNATEGARTSEDVANNISQIDTQNQQTQADQGSAFDKARYSLLRGGNAGGGIQAGQVQDITQQQNTKETRQGEAVNVAKRAQELFKGRKFEDLAKNTERATKSAATRKEDLSIDLNRYIAEQGFGANGEEGYAIKGKREDLAAAQANDLENKTQDEYNNLLDQFVATLRNPEQQAATFGAYRQ